MRSRTIVTVLLACTVAGSAAAQEPLADQLRKGIVQEEANGSVEKAIPIYQAIVSQFDHDRQAAATAVFRLGECYRKAGKKDLAVAAYQRVVREFGDQAALAESSRTQLAAFGATAPRTGAGSQVPREDYVKVWQELADRGRQLDAVSARLNAANARLAELNNKVPSGGVDPTADASPEMARVQLAIIEGNLVDMRKQVDAGLSSKTALRDLTAEYEIARHRYDELLAKKEAQQKLTQQTIKSIEEEIVLVERRVSEIQTRVELGLVSPNDAELLQLRRDLLSLQRKLAELRRE